VVFTPASRLPSRGFESGSGGKELQMKVAYIILPRDRCYGFKNIFAENFCEKIGVFDSKQSQILKKVDHNIGF
jgi:hypothetical protein